MNVNLHLWLIPVLPLIGAAINGLFGRYFSRRVVTAVGLLFTGASFVKACLVAAQFFSIPADKIPHIETVATWLRTGDFSADYAFYLDQLSLVMMLIVTGVGFLIHVYSVGYMAEEGGYYRFFSYLNLFMFFMLTLVLANNYLLMFVGWEGVGLASYLLIGFFFLRDSAASAGKKAFITNRIGDLGFLIAVFLLTRHFGSLDFSKVFPAVSKLGIENAGPGVLTAIALLLLTGACGKSAQIPLYVWLPDAMEGPTPVSALIHAATMVTAGVYMVARSNVIFDRAPTALMVVAIIGSLTAIFAATIGMAQTDIKKVLAYSTISQLGYMFLACGVAAYSAGIFHLMTHAFFKGLLFLAAGSVIHALGGEQDMRRMGGLRTKIPWTFWTMTAATFAIAGIPPLAGFFSKDQILWKAWSSPYGSWVYWAVAVFTALLTSFYMFRLWFLTFFGEFRGADAVVGEHAGHAHDQQAATEHHHVHESPPVMLVPLAILAVLSFAGGWIGVPHALGGSNHFDAFLSPVFRVSAEAMPAGEHPGEPQQQAASEHAERNTELALTAVSVGAALTGLFFAWLFYQRRRDLPDKIATSLGGIYTAVLNKYYVDEAYRAAFVQPLIEGSSRLLWQGVDAGTIDAAVNDSAEAARHASDSLRRMQSGLIRSYAGWVALGAAAVVAYMVWLGVR
ncbi:MAG: NADH-quinone oxidoreductase subunit L [Acidobacteriaceae bacterium]|nr:NADH-quinone oxidoreductase subunit L [Acidobacteriaceae bacterium]